MGKARLANTDDTPYLSALLKGGLGAVDIDGWKAAKFGMATIMVFLIFSSLGSYSWYNLEHEESVNDEVGTLCGRALAQGHVPEESQREGDEQQRVEKT